MKTYQCFETNSERGAEGVVIRKLETKGIFIPSSSANLSGGKQATQISDSRDQMAQT